MKKQTKPKLPKKLTPANTGVYVMSIDRNTYHGPYLQVWDYFTTTAKASAYVGCDYDQIGAVFRYTKRRRWGWGGARVKGVYFISPAAFREELGLRAPVVDPVPGKLRFPERTHEVRVLIAKSMIRNAEDMCDPNYSGLEDDVPYET